MFAPPALRVVLPLALVLLTTPLRAKDVFGNNSAWTVSDTIIWELQGKRAAEESRQRESWRPKQVNWIDQLRANEKERREAAAAKATEAARATLNDKAESPTRRASAAPYVPNQPYASSGDHLHDQALRGGFDAAFKAASYFSEKKDSRAIQWLEKCANYDTSKESTQAAWWLIGFSARPGPLHDDIRAVRYLRLLVSRGDLDAMATLAQANLDGKMGLTAAPAAAISLYEKIAQSGAQTFAPFHAAALLATFYEGKPGIPADEAKSLAWQRTAARVAVGNNVAYAKSLLARRLMTVAGGWTSHHAEIMPLLDESARGNDEAAMLLAQLLTETGKDLTPAVPADPLRAREILNRRVWEQHSSILLRDLFIALCLRPGPSHDATAAAKMYQGLVHHSTDGGRAALQAANLYADGEGNLKANPEVALALYEQAMSRAPALRDEAAARYARLLIRLNDDSRLPPALKLLRELAGPTSQSAPSNLARYELARLHLSGRGVARDVPTAIKLLEKSCERDREPEGFPAATLLGKLFSEGRLISQDQSRAYRHLSRPAYHNYAPAQYEFGVLRYQWKDEPLDSLAKFEAFMRVNSAANAGHADARLLLARFYREGFGRATPEPESALAIYQSGDLAGNATASVELAALHLEEKSSFFNPAAAFAAARNAATSGHAPGLNLVGMCHLRGWGTAKDSAAALSYFQKAADAGYWTGARNTAKLLCLGDGIPAPDPQKAAQVLEAASRRAAASSKRETGRLYLGKDFLPANPARARFWLTQAADGFDPEAMFLLGQLHLEPAVDAAPNRAEALAQFRRASDAGHIDATLALVRTLFQDPARSAVDTAKLQAALRGSSNDYGPETPAEAEQITATIGKLNELLSRAQDPERSYQFALLLLNEPNTIAPPFGFLSRAESFLIQAAAAGNHDAQYRCGIEQLGRARFYLKDPAGDKLNLATFGVGHSEAYAISARNYLRDAAAGGHEKALAYLKRHDLPLAHSAELEPAALKKLLALLPGD